jgi:hypothetical protein
MPINDQMKWTNYYGLGNETMLTTKERDFNRVRSQQFLGKIGVQRVYNNRQRITINPFFQSYDVINDTAGIWQSKILLPAMKLTKQSYMVGSK